MSQKEAFFLFGLFASMIVSCDALRQCNNTTTFCADDEACCSALYSPTKFGCQLERRFSQNHDIRYGKIDDDSYPPSPTVSCCMPGPALEPSTEKRNCMILGDSVSIGYAGVAANALKDMCQTQHSPFDVSDGGAGSTHVGVACLDNFLVTQRQTTVKWDVILYNFGLHNLDNSSEAKATYREEFTNITTRLLDTGAKLIFATTTPFMPDTLQGNPIVPDLNKIALEVIDGKGIEVLDLHQLVMEQCSPPPAHTAPYVNCSLCRMEPCSYHYNSDGETIQGNAVADAIRKILTDDYK